ncbi:MULTISPECIES: ADP-ribosyltransferase, partial [unclassified Streptomyces]|uniref:ADP-ribosyltransferase n=1 Tax=unclassified Streptomyces TaxID=2593676 RepID=UPI00081DA123
PWGYTQVCTEKPTTGGSDGGKDDDKDKDDKDKDDKDEDESEDEKDKCDDGALAPLGGAASGTPVSFSGSLTTGATGTAHFALASADVGTSTGTRTATATATTTSAGAWHAAGTRFTLAADEPDAASAQAALQALSAASLSGFGTYQEAEDAVQQALGSDQDQLNPNVGGDNPGDPTVDQDNPGDPSLGGSCSDPDANQPMDPFHVLDDIPPYRPGKDGRKEWSEEVERIARENPLTKDFTAEDALIIADYTGPWANDANMYLRGQPVSGSRAGKVPEFIEKMDRALEHLPPVSATVYRGTFMPQDMLDKYAAGEEITMPEYLSTSTDINKAQRAAANAKSNGRQGESVLVRIETDNGRNIDPLSRYRGRESEVLIPRDGKFTQTGTETTIIDGKEYKVIVLKQTG